MKFLRKGNCTVSARLRILLNGQRTPRIPGKPAIHGTQLSPHPHLRHTSTRKLTDSFSRDSQLRFDIYPGIEYLTLKLAVFYEEDGKPKVLGSTEISIKPALERPITTRGGSDEGYDLDDIPIYWKDEEVGNMSLEMSFYKNPKTTQKNRRSVGQAEQLPQPTPTPQPVKQINIQHPPPVQRTPIPQSLPNFYPPSQPQVPMPSVSSPLPSPPAHFVPPAPYLPGPPLPPRRRTVSPERANRSQFGSVPEFRNSSQSPSRTGQRVVEMQQNNYLPPRTLTPDADAFARQQHPAFLNPQGWDNTGAFTPQIPSTIPAARRSSEMSSPSIPAYEPPQPIFPAERTERQFNVPQQYSTDPSRRYSAPNHAPATPEMSSGYFTDPANSRSTPATPLYPTSHNMHPHSSPIMQASHEQMQENYHRGSYASEEPISPLQPRPMTFTNGSANKRSPSTFSRLSYSESVFQELASAELSPRVYAPDMFDRSETHTVPPPATPVPQQPVHPSPQPSAASESRKVPRKPLPKNSPLAAQLQSDSNTMKLPHLPGGWDTSPVSEDPPRKSQTPPQPSAVRRVPVPAPAPAPAPPPVFASAASIALSPALQKLDITRTRRGKTDPDSDELQPSSHAPELGTQEGLETLSAVSPEHRKMMARREEVRRQKMMEEKARLAGTPPLPPKIPRGITKEEWEALAAARRKSSYD
ncbi:hypothetical protein BZA70DRAFT_51673 [Myxozyma melibiosi]|uniref:C2 NT-type domain-containing protein n=1 Tax=Myxozyma melibiosi TaxID=54550 RepID=A0ABR1FF59_9ASCO